MRDLALQHDACAGAACHTSAALSRTVQGFELAKIEWAILSADLALHEVSVMRNVGIRRRAAPWPRVPP